ncbi:transmembrane protein 180-like [Patiria miniata]|uniref:Transmembrane protein 180 n=1 Tax=Patiria miniata TaxID=46514 RepID=A0A914B3J6_PATMI|nr:transmembrane protein 180-like [Patiria miniata]
MLSETRVGVCYGSMALFLSIIHNVFLLYHVEVFVSVYHIDKTSFWIGETIFLIWNSLNDPLFGWLSDKSLLNSDKTVGRFGVQPELVIKRLWALTVNGPLFALSFMLFWFVWAFPGLQFAVVLCLYDGFLTAVDLHHTALLADLALSAKDRTKLNGYSSFFSAAGSLSVFLSYVVWDRDTMQSFQIFCFVLAMFSAVGFFFVSRHLSRQYQDLRKKDDGMTSVISVKPQDVTTKATTEDEVTIKRYIKQLSKHSNFQYFSLLNLVQVFNCHFNSNFFPLFLERLLGRALSPGMGSLLIGVSFVIPHLNNLYFLSLCRKYSIYAVIKWLFYCKCLLSGFMLFAGPDNLWLLCVFIASNRVFTEGTCKLLNLVISDLVDEDCVIHRRKQAVSALVFGTAALLSKPGQTIAPLLGTTLLAIQTGQDIFQSKPGNSLRAIESGLTVEESEVVRLGCFHCLVYIPLLCAMVQILLWTRFTLRGARLEWVKRVRAGDVFTHV